MKCVCVFICVRVCYTEEYKFCFTFEICWQLNPFTFKIETLLYVIPVACVAPLVASPPTHQHRFYLFSFFFSVHKHLNAWMTIACGWQLRFASSNREQFADSGGGELADSWLVKSRLSLLLKQEASTVWCCNLSSDSSRRFLFVATLFRGVVFWFTVFFHVRKDQATRRCLTSPLASVYEVFILCKIKTKISIFLK